MSRVALFAILTLTCCFIFNQSEALKVKTDINELTLLEKLYIRLHYPNFPLKELEKDASISEYQGLLETWNIDLPMLLLQLAKFSDKIPLPSWHYEYGFYYCYMGICVGFLNVYEYRNAILINANKADLKTSMNGTVLKLDFTAADIQIQSPETTKHETDLITNDQVFWRGYSAYAENYKLGFTGNFTMGPNGLQVNKVDITFSMDAFSEGYHNATHTLPDGTTEEWGPAGTDYLEGLMDFWDSIEEDAEAMVETYLNCFLVKIDMDFFHSNEVHRAMVEMETRIVIVTSMTRPTYKAFHNFFIPLGLLDLIITDNESE